MAGCMHETPGGRDRCALCRAEDRMLADPHAGARADWIAITPPGTPMPDWFRDIWHQLTDHQDT